MYNSVGDIAPNPGALLSDFKNGAPYTYTRLYRHRAGTEPGSSGAGVYDFEASGTAIGIIVAEEYTAAKRVKDQKRGGYPNFALMLTPDMVTNINTWLAATP